MIDSFYIAWRYLSFSKVRTGTLVACVTLIAFLPISLNTLLVESERQLLTRAESTPLVFGSSGSSLDLMMNTLYFADGYPQTVSMAEVNQLADSAMAATLPLYARFEARGFPIVGVTVDYFDFRKLNVSHGRGLLVLGDAVIGAEVARQLELSPGDSIVSTVETVFDLAGVYPLKMNVAGVLQRSYTSDDVAVFVDLKTAWVIQGLGHGHVDLAKNSDPTVVLERNDGKIVANAKLVQYAQITEENIDSFHFHGAAADYPLTAVIVVPNDDKSETILRGRYLDDRRFQLSQSVKVIDGLMQNIFRVKNLIDGIILMVGLATVAAIVLVFAMSLRLRQREIRTITRIGCRRMTITGLVCAEIMIISVTSGLLCIILLQVVNLYSNALVRGLLMG